METMPSFLSPSITTYPLLAIVEPKSINSLASSFDFGRSTIETSAMKFTSDLQLKPLPNRGE